MVIVVVTAADMVADGRGMVMVERTALIFGVHILQNNVVEPCGILQAQFGTKQPVLEVVEEVAMLLLDVPLVAGAIAVVVEVQHHGVVFKILVGIESEVPRVVVEVQPCHPAAEVVAAGILPGIAVGRVAATRQKGMPHTLQSALIADGGAIASVRRTAKLAGHLQS